MKTRISILLIALSTIFSCQQNQSSDSAKIKKDMIKVAIFYPNGEGKTFDMDYYSNKHMPMASNLFGDSLKAMVIDQGMTGRTPDSPAKYAAIGYFYFETIASFKTSMGENSEKLRKDVPNFTNIIPEIQVSKVQTAE
ncbi:EthD family reductase [Urechidicola croceus]|uniref:Ethyl tert-butyl ether degradation protein EthD n=1 Tax=Urechidicola croceus TaxID=1850246 RepID=A0A1D8P3S9_9FLAO|nr:EthD family reductase [Urechidicola croceus]AOW19239.1 ethyl tert-butyl ether degradation protein EthD [Urechidicola croceus]